MSQQPSGWYDDPSSPDMLRYWDGVTWTNHTAPKKSPTAAQSTIGLPQAQPPQAQPPQADAGAAGQPPAYQGGPYPGGYPYGQQGQGQGQYPGQYPQAPANAAWMAGVKTTIDGVPLASWGRRFGAWLIDGIILFVLTFVLWRALAPEVFDSFGHVLDVASTGDQSAVEEATQDFQSVMLSAAPKVGLASFLLVFVYCVAFWTTTAQTPGKMAVGISVRRADRPGVLDLGTAVRRRVVSLVQILPIPFLPFLVMMLDGLWPLWDDRQQALHDKVAGTQVVMGKQPRKG